MRHGGGSRTEILDAAQSVILAHGYAGASVEAILERTRLTKGAFFHHFPSKQHLAQALIERYAAQDWAHFEATFERAARLSRDPVQRVLILVGLYEEHLAKSAEPYRGCLFASYCYQAGLFDDRIHAIIRDSLLQWREVLGQKLADAMAHRPPRMAVEPHELADTFLTMAEGGFVMSKALKDPTIVSKQLRQFRNYLKLLFAEA